MLKSMSFKHVFDRCFTHKRGATATSFRQYLFIPSPSGLLDTPGVDSSSKIFVVNPSKVKLKLEFYNSVDQFVDFNGGTSPSIEFSKIPDLRYSSLVDDRTIAFMQNYFRRYRAPVWNIERLPEITFSASAASYGSSLDSEPLSTDRHIVAAIGWIFDDADDAHMSPVPLLSDDEVGFYKSTRQIVTAVSDVLQLRMLSSFDTLPYDGQLEDVEPFAISITDANLFDINSVAQGRYLSTGSATDYRLRIPSIAGNLTSGNDYAVVFDLMSIEWVSFD
jgi:hypothetical protein